MRELTSTRVTSMFPEMRTPPLSSAPFWRSTKNAAAASAAATAIPTTIFFRLEGSIMGNDTIDYFRPDRRKLSSGKYPAWARCEANVDIDELRKRIDLMDDVLLRIFNERARIALEIGQREEGARGCRCSTRAGRNASSPA